MNAIPAPQRPNLQALKTRRFWAPPLIIAVAASHKLLAPQLAAAIGNLAPPTHPIVSIAISWLNHGLNLDAPFVTVAALALFQWSSHYRWADITKEAIMLGLFKTAKREMLEQVRSEARDALIRELKADPEKARQILNGKHEEPADRTCPLRNAGPSVPKEYPHATNRKPGLRAGRRRAQADPPAATPRQQGTAIPQTTASCQKPAHGPAAGRNPNRKQPPTPTTAPPTGLRIMNQNPFGNPEQIPSGLMSALVLTYWIAAAAVAVSAVKLVSCHLGGTPPQACGWWYWPHLGFLFGMFTVIGTTPFFLADLFEQIQRLSGPDDGRHPALPAAKRPLQLPPGQPDQDGEE